LLLRIMAGVDQGHQGGRHGRPRARCIGFLPQRTAGKLDPTSTSKGNRELAVKAQRALLPDFKTFRWAFVTKAMGDSAMDKAVGGRRE